MCLEGKQDSSLLTPPHPARKHLAAAYPADGVSYAARIIARRFGIPAYVAALVAELAGLAVRS
jgi:hypothetical protein